MLYGEDNITDICIGPNNNSKTLHYIETVDADVSINPWNNSLHLLSKYNFLIYPRASDSIDHEILFSNIKNNIILFKEKIKKMNENNILSKSNPTKQIFVDQNNNKLFGEYNYNTGKNNIVDIQHVLDELSLVKIQKKILTIYIDHGTSESEEKLKISEISSTKIRDLLKNKNIENRLCNTKLINQVIKIVPLSIVYKLINSKMYYY